MHDTFTQRTYLHKTYKGLEFKIASTSVVTVNISSSLGMWGATIFLIFLFMLFTAASEKPPKCGALGGGLKSQVTSFSEICAVVSPLAASEFAATLYELQ